MFLLIMGPPGSGKGTQAKILAREFQIPHISSGDIFRQAMEIDDELGRELQLAINKGQLVPDGILAIIPKKIINDIPLPIPFSLICSPSHISNIVPAVSVEMLTIQVYAEGSRKAL